jgi:SAM-dependent methyltransferase
VPDNPRLLELRSAYGSLDLPVRATSRWHKRAVDSFLDLRWFRGESLFVWHYRELPRISELKYYIFARYVRDRDELRLLDRLEEDGAFGCWTFCYPGWGRVSRDLLQSVNEISFLERELHLSGNEGLRVLDIGAGYGRLGHRMALGLQNLADYCCVDTIAEATFLSEWYLRYRGCVPPCRVARLDRLDTQIRGRQFDLAINIHSFSECPLHAVQWWISLLAELEVARLLIVPNDPSELLSTEEDGGRRDFNGLLEAAGYELVTSEPVINDAAIRELIPLQDQFYLFARAAE